MRARQARRPCVREMEDRSRMELTEVSRLQVREEDGMWVRDRGSRRKQKTDTHRREKAERWSVNLDARHTELKTAALMEICQETTGAGRP